ncbi:hypothetical protein CSIRO_3103 [Bradyrhizobiaceae bacterium SG-6C]|nr:hypothetical protein CSIRO_3103 [Bradyrhizobiaceae bacterium SG-6C]
MLPDGQVSSGSVASQLEQLILPGPQPWAAIAFVEPECPSLSSFSFPD